MYIKKILTILLLLSTTSAINTQQVLIKNRQVTATGCTPPAIDSRLASDNPANTCTSGCSNGNDITNLADFIDGRSAPDSHGAATYTTGILTLPVMNFHNPVSGYVFPVTPLVGTYYIITDSNCPSSSFCTMNAGNNGDQSLNWRLNTNSNEIEINSQGQAILVTTSGAAPGSWHLYILSYDVSNNIIVNKCNAGSCSVIGSGNANTHIPGGGFLSLGAQAGLDPSYQGYVAEWGYSTNSSFSVTTLATWSFCHWHV